MKLTVPKTILMAAAAIGFLTTTSCMQNKEANPFLEEYTTEYQIPPFDKILPEHYMPAFEEGIRQQNEEIAAIVANPEAPTFENTVLALDNSGKVLDKVNYVFSALSESDNSPEMEEISAKAMPMLAAHSDEIMMNDELFARIKVVYDNKESMGLDTAQSRLVDKYYKQFVRNGALLEPEQKERLKTINQELSSLYLAFSSNILKETNEWGLVVENEGELKGLSENAIATAAEEAKKRGMEGKWVFTLHAPSRLAVLSYADSRDLREKMYKGYTSLASKDNEYNNSANINKIVKLRDEKAKLLGFDNFAAYQMDAVMAKTVDAAQGLLMQIWKPAVAKAQEEIVDMQALADAEGAGITIEPWDYYYYAEKVKKQKFDVNDDAVRPYFQLENVRKGLFSMAEKLYGITFTEMPDAPKYHPEVTVYDVKDKNGEHVAVFMTDYFPRAGKRQGAWMSEMKAAYNNSGMNERPIIFNVCNFTKPSGDTPALLTLDEVETMFHEFGHALHGMLTRAEYKGQSGTNVDRDFVELPSQIDEHWAMEPELLKEYAIHYQTGEVIPDSLVEKLDVSSKFNMGFITTELAGAALLDIAWHTAAMTDSFDVKGFENEVSKKLGKPSQIEYRYRSPYFKHIFGSDHYAAGYYTYLWAEVLDADGFELFREKGIFDPETAAAYKALLEAGDTRDPMELFVKFRGHKPTPDALLRNRGLK